MKLKKIFAALAASALVVSMMGISAMAEGLDGNGDVITDEPIEEPAIVAPIEEPVVTEAPVVDVTPVAPAPSPATGNSPVAMAVIPVALAAAAVVAKKAK